MPRRKRPGRKPAMTTTGEAGPASLTVPERWADRAEPTANPKMSHSWSHHHLHRPSPTAVSPNLSRGRLTSTRVTQVLDG